MAEQQIKRPRGTTDYYGEQEKLFLALDSILKAEAKAYGTTPCELPMFEENRLFHRSVGEGSDIVLKETFDLVKKGDKDFTLRPEFTASVSRMVIENKLYNSPDMPLRISYLGPVFRYERLQTGRLRQFYQFGAEFIDTKIDLASTLDAFLFALTAAEKALGHKVIAKINFLGSLESRENYKAALKAFFAPHVDSMCDDCKRRFEVNPLRILDCKVQEDQEICKDAPKIKDYLSEEDQKEYQNILKALDDIGVSYEVDDSLVRGLDYYTGLVFELYDSINTTLGAIGGGGKYASLMRQIGGPDMEGIGFSLGMERLLLALTEQRKQELLQEESLDYFLIDFARDGFGSYVASKLREKGYSVTFSSYSRALGGAFKMADRLKAKNALIIEQDHRIQKKDMLTRNQIEVSLDTLLKEEHHA